MKLENAFPPEIAAAARAILWRAVDCDPEDRTTWTRPVIRLGDFAQEPFRLAVNTSALHAAFDDLAGVGRWIPRQSLGGFPIRFRTRTIRETRDGMWTRVFRRTNRLMHPGRISIGASI